MRGQVREKIKDYCPHLEHKNALLKVNQKIRKTIGNLTPITDNIISSCLKPSCFYLKTVVRMQHKFDVSTVLKV